MLRYMIRLTPTTLEDHLPFIKFTYNQYFHSSIGFPHLKYVMDLNFCFYDFFIYPYSCKCICQIKGKGDDEHSL